MATTSARTQGIIKRILYEEGFGFIRATSGEDHFFHRASLLPDNRFATVQEHWSQLAENTRVEFQSVPGKEGKKRAIEIRQLDAPRV